MRRVSVVITTYKRPNFLERAIASVLNQTYKNYELIVVDDFGLLENRSVVEKFNNSGTNIKYIRHRSNFGVSFARNTGISNSSGELFCFLDDDDFFLENHLEENIRSIEENKNCKAVYSDCDVLVFANSNDINSISTRYSEWRNDYSLERLRFSNVCPPVCFMVDRVCFETVGKFDVDLESHEDWDMWLRISEKFDIKRNPVLTCLYSKFLDVSSLSDNRSVMMKTLNMVISKMRQRTDNKTAENDYQDSILMKNAGVYQNSRKLLSMNILKYRGSLDGISVVFSGREIDRKFIDHIQGTIGVKDVEIIPYLNKGEFSLAELYNKELLRESKYDIVLFVHDDVIFNQKNWGKVILKLFHNTDYGILGLAGTTDLVKDNEGTVQAWSAMKNRMVGRIRHEVNGKVINSFYSNRYDHPIQVVCLDGVFMAVNKRRIREPFDERFRGFHYYDIPFTLSNHLAGVKVGVTFEIDLTHKSGGSFNVEWQENRLLFSELYGRLLPCGIKPDRIEYDSSTIKKFNPGNSFVSVIIPTKDRIELVIDCIQSIIKHTNTTQYEILVADTGSTAENRSKLSNFINEIARRKNLSEIRLIEYDQYNFARINNDVVKNHLSKKSNYILFCNNDIKLLNDAIDRCLRLFKEKKDVGTVGIRLHYGDNSIQHNGMEALFGFSSVVAFTHRNIHSYYRYDREVVEVAGNTAAFLMIERRMFEEFYFNENYKECFEDIELNLQILKAGRKNYQIGHAVAYHYESQTRNEDPDKISRVMEDYHNYLLPFFKKHCIPLFINALFEGASRASREGQYQTAVEIGELLLEHAPQHSDIHHLLGVIHGRGGDQAQAVQYLRQAIALNSRMPSYHYNLAEALRRRQDWRQAEHSYRQALRLAPNMLDACVHLAEVLREQGRMDEALACYRQALQLKPDHVAGYCGMGDLLYQQGAYDVAIECFQRAVQLQPDLTDAHHRLGMALSRLENRLEEAAGSYRQVLKYRPDSVEAWINLGKVLVQQGFVEEGRECYQQVLAMGIDDPLFRLRVESLCPPVPASQAAIDSYRAALRARLTAWGESADMRLDLALLHTSDLEPPSALIYQGGDDRPIKEAWAALFQPLLPEVEPPSLPAGRRPHIGFIVTYRHEQAFLKGMAGILNQLSAGRFDLTVVCSQQGSEARLRTGIHNPAVRYLPLPERIDHSVERLRQGRFAVLYHWEVGTDSLNYFLPFFRLAPVQCTGWGWPVTSGIPGVDYYLSARHLETADSDAQYSERLVRFQRLPTCYSRPERSAAPAARERFGLSAGQRVYVCAQNPRKIHPDFDALLAGVLRRDPGGVVVMVEDVQPALMAALRQRWQTQLPDVIERVRFLPWLAYSDYLDLLAVADVALDTLHFGSGITAYDALAVGLPIVTLPGMFSRGRYVQAVYRQMGLDEGIATDPADYIEQAVRFASEPDYRAAFGARLRTASAELFEDRQAVREFEEFLETAVASL